MKKILVTLAAVAVTVGAFAQGQVTFKNVFTPYAFVYLADGVTKVPASVAPNVGAYAVDLYYGPAGITDMKSLTPLGLQVNFSTVVAQAGLFSGGTQFVPGVPAGSVATLQVRAWETKGGLYTSYAAALQGATGLVGEGNLVQVALNTAPATPPNMVGITPITLHQVPEPTVAAIAGLGLASMLILRRKK